MKGSTQNREDEVVLPRLNQTKIGLKEAHVYTLHPGTLSGLNKTNLGLKEVGILPILRDLVGV